MEGPVSYYGSVAKRTLSYLDFLPISVFDIQKLIRTKLLKFKGTLYKPKKNIPSISVFPKRFLLTKIKPYKYVFVVYMNILVM